MRNNVNEFYRGQKFFQVYDHYFTAETLGQLSTWARSLDDQLRPGRAANQSLVESLRRSEVTVMTMGPQTQWVFDLLNPIMEDINHSHWGMTLWGYDRIQVACYGPGDYHHWQTDMIYARPGADQRKLTALISLSHRDEYQGGELEFLRGPEPEVIPQTLGRITVFPSWVLHRVRPVTQGLRRSLALWLQGPKFQ
jgi:PKHD-type hydroxylase